MKNGKNYVNETGRKVMIETAPGRVRIDIMDYARDLYAEILVVVDTEEKPDKLYCRMAAEDFFKDEVIEDYTFYKMYEHLKKLYSVIEFTYSFICEDSENPGYANEHYNTTYYNNVRKGEETFGQFYKNYSYGKFPEMKDGFHRIEKPIIRFWSSSYSDTRFWYEGLGSITFLELDEYQSEDVILPADLVCQEPLLIMAKIMDKCVRHYYEKSNDFFW